MESICRICPADWFSEGIGMKRKKMFGKNRPPSAGEPAAWNASGKYLERAEEVAGMPDEQGICGRGGVDPMTDRVCVLRSGAVTASSARAAGRLLKFLHIAIETVSKVDAVFSQETKKGGCWR